MALPLPPGEGWGEGTFPDKKFEKNNRFKCIPNFKNSTYKSFK